MLSNFDQVGSQHRRERMDRGEAAIVPPKNTKLVKNRPIQLIFFSNISETSLPYLHVLMRYFLKFEMSEQVNAS